MTSPIRQRLTPTLLFLSGAAICDFAGLSRGLTLGSFIFAVLLSGTASVAHSAQAAEQEDLQAFLLHRNHLIIGVVDSVNRFMSQPKGACGSGRRPLPTSEFVISVHEVLEGVGINRVERVRAHGLRAARAIPPGTRVLAFGNRTCADEWRIWGNAIALGPEDELVGHEGFRKRIDSWRQREGRTPRLSDFRGQIERSSSRASAAFRRFHGVHLMRIVGRTPPGGPSVVLEVESIGQLVGAPHPAPRRVEFATHRDSNCHVFAAGDTLIVPYIADDPNSTQPSFESCADYFQVDQGRLPQLNVAVTQFMDAVERDGDTFALRSIKEGRTPK